VSSKASPQPDAILAVRLPAALRDRLKAEADASHRSMGGQVRWLLEQSLPVEGERQAA
jgi:plasmid stability protein